MQAVARLCDRSQSDLYLALHRHAGVLRQSQALLCQGHLFAGAGRPGARAMRGLCQVVTGFDAWKWRYGWQISERFGSPAGDVFGRGSPLSDHQEYAEEAHSQRRLRRCALRGVRCLPLMQ
jgi:hypothetical protein